MHSHHAYDKTYSRDQALVAADRTITRRLPPPSTTKTLLLQVISLPDGSLGVVKSHELLLDRVPTPRRESLLVSVDLAAVLGKALVVEDTGLEAAFTGAVELLTHATTILAEIDDVGERATVKRETEMDLAGRSDVGLVEVDGLLGVERHEPVFFDDPAIG